MDISFSKLKYSGNKLRTKDNLVHIQDFIKLTSTYINNLIQLLENVSVCQKELKEMLTIKSQIKHMLKMVDMYSHQSQNYNNKRLVAVL